MQKNLFAALVVFLGLASVVFGQNAGTITGRVVDQTAAVVAGAEVKVTDVSTGETQKATTNDTGLYFFNTIKPGTYDVSIEKAGFRKAQFTKQTVEIGSATELALEPSRDRRHGDLSDQERGNHRRGGGSRNLEPLRRRGRDHVAPNVANTE